MAAVHGTGVEPGPVIADREPDLVLSVGDLHLGVRGARVVPERRATSSYLLRLPLADSDLDQRVRALDGALAGRDWRACD